MIDNHDIDPEILEYLENEFLAFDLLGHPPASNANAPVPNESARSNLQLFRSLHSMSHHDIHPDGDFPTPARRSHGLLDDDLTPIPWNRRTNSFDNRGGSNALLTPTPLIYDVKFYCDLHSLQGLPKTISVEAPASSWLCCFPDSFHYFTLSLKIGSESRSFKLVRHINAGGQSSPRRRAPEVVYGLKFMPSQRTSSSTSSTLPELWEFADYYGTTSVEIELRKHSSFTYQSSVLARKKMSLQHFFDEQKRQEKTRQYLSASTNYDWLHSFPVELDLLPAHPNMLRRMSGGSGAVPSSRPGGGHQSHPPSSNNTQAGTNSGMDWWASFNTKRGRFTQPKHPNPSNASTAQRAGPALTQVRPMQPKPRIKLNLSFRLIFLQNCLKPIIHTTFLTTPNHHSNSPHAHPSSNPPTHLNTTTSNTPSSDDDDSTHLMTDFHILVAQAPSPVVVEVMKSLAWRGVLPKVLSSPTSLGFWPLEVALRVGNATSVLELLQRTGYLCFPPLLPKHSSPLHHVIVGKSSLCYEYLQKFLKKYGGGPRSPTARGNRQQQQLYENLTWDNCLEWKDGNDDTPFTLACSLPQRISFIRELLLAGANLAAINSRTNRTGFMHACEHGDRELVEILLSIQDIPRAEQEVIDQIRTMTTQRGLVGMRNMVFTHHHASLHSISGMNFDPDVMDEESDYPSPLSLAQYSCLPTFRDPLSGKQALHIAAQFGHTEIVAMLLRIGVSCGEVDNDGRSLYHIAVEHKHPAVIAQVIEVEREKWRHYCQLQLPHSRHKTGGYETMMAPQKPLFLRDWQGRLALDLARDRGERKIALTLVRAMIDIYGGAHLAKRAAATSSASPSPRKGNSHSHHGTSFISLNISPIRRPVDSEPAAPYKSSSLGMSEEVFDYLSLTLRQLERDSDASAAGYDVDFHQRQEERRRREKEGGDVSAVVVRASSSDVITGNNEGEGKEEPRLSQSEKKKTKSLFLSPFSTDWIGSVRGRERARNGARRGKGGLGLFGRESKEETLALEEKGDDLAIVVEEDEKEEEEDWMMDKEEYMMALSPLSLKALKPDADV
eukprot:gene12465-13636_t